MPVVKSQSTGIRKYPYGFPFREPPTNKPHKKGRRFLHQSPYRFQGDSRGGHYYNQGQAPLNIIDKVSTNRGIGVLHRFKDMGGDRVPYLYKTLVRPIIIDRGLLLFIVPRDKITIKALAHPGGMDRNVIIMVLFVSMKVELSMNITPPLIVFFYFMGGS